MSEKHPCTCCGHVTCDAEDSLCDFCREYRKTQAGYAKAYGVLMNRMDAIDSALADTLGVIASEIRALKVRLEALERETYGDGRP